jgi:hypothetical protein
VKHLLNKKSKVRLTFWRLVSCILIFFIMVRASKGVSGPRLSGPLRGPGSASEGNSRSTGKHICRLFMMPYGSVRST